MPDQETIQGQLNLLNTYRKRLRIQIDQQQKMGVHAPAYIQLEIDDAQAQIKKIKKYLRENSVAVENAPEDGDQDLFSSATQPVQPHVDAAALGIADVFISYHPADRVWVRSELLPMLEQAGLNYIIDYRDFAIGAPKIVNMENAVADSRHTLIVITPDWLTSDWNNFQGLLAASADPGSVERKLLPLLLKPTQLPSRIAYLEATDLTDPNEREFQIGRLIRGLSARNTEPSVPVPTPASTAEPKTIKGTRPLVNASSVDFVIITALEEERDAILAHLPGSQRIVPSATDVRTYRYARVPFTFPDASTGEYTVAVLSLISMGRVEASLATSDAIRRWSPRYVLMVGIAGGIEDEGVRLGDVLISNQVIDYETQKIKATEESIRYSGHRVDPRLLDAAQNLPASDWRTGIICQRPGSGQPKRIVGPVATGDKVIARKALLDKLRADWPKLIGVEMEAGGAAAAAFQSAQNPGFFMIRGVSDLADEHKGEMSVDEWREYACDVAAAYAVGLLKSGPVPLK